MRIQNAAQQNWSRQVSILSDNYEGFHKDVPLMVLVGSESLQQGVPCMVLVLSCTYCPGWY